MVVTLGLSFGASLLGRDCPENTVQIAVSGNHQPGPVCMPLASQGDVMKHTPSTNDTVATREWIAAGGRGLDSAWSYDHGGYGHAQRQTGVGIRQSGVDRADLFVTSKIPCGATEQDVVDLVKYDLDQLMIARLDLVLIHTPTRAGKCNSTNDVTTTWKGLELARSQNLTAAIGVSNFDVVLLEQLLVEPTTHVLPAVNQIAMSVGQVDHATVQYCHKKGITIEAFSPLGHPDGGKKPVYDLPEVVAIAKAHNVTGAQVALRWLVQQQVPFVTASPTMEYDEEDMAIFNFTLTADDMATLSGV